MSRRFTLAFAVVGVLPLIGLALVSYDFTCRLMANQVMSQLRSMAGIQRHRIESLLELKRDQLRLITTQTSLRAHLANYLDGSESAMNEGMTTFLEDVKGERQDWLSVLSKEGVVLASTESRLLGDPAPADKLLLEFARVDHVFGEMFLDSQDRAAVDIYGPLRNVHGELIGLAWIRTYLTELESITHDYTGLGQTGETLLAKRGTEGQVVFLTPVRFNPNDEFRRKAAVTETPADVSKALQDETGGLPFTIDYRGAPTISAMEYIPEYDCGIVVKIDRAEALRPVLAYAKAAIWMLVFTSLAVVSVTLILANSITRPLQKLTQSAERIRDGDLTAKLEVSNQEEVGKLAQAMRAMAGNLIDANLELAKEAEFRRLIVDTAMDAVLTIDRAGAVKVWNPQAELVFGWKAAEAKGRELDSLIAPPDARQSFRSRLLDFDETSEANQTHGHSRRYELELIRKDGNRFPAELAISPMFLDEDYEFGIFIRDITDQQKAESALRHVNSELQSKNDEVQQLVYTVSHDLKSPLVTCKGFVDVMRESLLQREFHELGDSMERIDRATKRMDQLIDDLLQISRIGSIPIEHELLDTNRLTSLLIEEFQGRGGFNDVEFCCGDLPQLWADKTQAAAVFENLISNALKYGCGAEQPCIELGGEVQAGETRIFVSDNGRGIPTEFRQKVFRLFQRLESKKPGAGVGLAAVTRIMDVHGGRVWIDSEHHPGVKFWIAFPAPPPTATARLHSDLNPNAEDATVKMARTGEST